MKCIKWRYIISPDNENLHNDIDVINQRREYQIIMISVHLVQKGDK